MTRQTIPNWRGMPMPNLDAVGLQRKMKEAAKLIAEQEKLTRRASDLGYEAKQLEETIKNSEFALAQEWGRRIRSGEDAPDSEETERAKTRLKALRREIAALTHAAQLADAELIDVVQTYREEWDGEVQAKAEKILAEAQQLAQKLSGKLSETEPLVGVHTWLESGGMSYTPPMPASVSIDNLLHERMRELGLLDVGVVG